MARLLQLTDLHVVAPGKLCSGVLDTREILRAVIDRILDRRPRLDPLDAVLITGDISDDGSPESYEHAHTQLDRLGLPILPIPGNHDTREAFREGFADLSIISKEGLIDWSKQIGDTLVVGLDTLVQGEGGGQLRQESLDYLSITLSDASPGPVVVALHHPPLRTQIQFMDAIGLENTSALATILDGAKQDITVVAGHVHGIHHGRIGRHIVITAPSICSTFAVDRRANAPVGFMTAPTGCAVIDTATDGVWSAISLDDADGPFPF